MRRIHLLPLAAIALGLAGCGTSARYVNKQTDGGIVAIPQNSDAWPTHYRQQAESLIRQHVGPGFEVVDEREVATGADSWNNQQSQIQPMGPSAVTTGTTMTRTSTEWQITYRRREAGGTTIQTEYVSPGGASGVPPPASVVPAGFRSRLSNFDAGKDCKT